MFNLDLLTVVGTVLVIAEIFGLLFAVDAVIRPRSSQGAIAWFIALITFPLVTVPLYIVFGRTRFLGYSEAIRVAEAQVGERLAHWYSRMNDTAAAPQEGVNTIERLVHQISGVPFLHSNRVKLLLDGEATYASMVDAINSANVYILVQFYIVRDDSIGRHLRNALIEKARSGVRVHFLYDEIGSIKLSNQYLDEMRRDSVEVSGFKTTQGYRNRFQINFRNHRKLLIVDGRCGFIGGHNLGDEYLKYRDTHLRIEGPAAQHIQLTFLKDWYWATGRIADVNSTIEGARDGTRAVAIINTGPADAVKSCSILFSALVNKAQRRLWLTSPYFVPDDIMVRALQAAALRGVDVRIILPDEADQRFVELASFTYYADMLNCGVRLFRYQGLFMHQKVILVDDNLSGIGTVNLDNRSLYLNFEATALVADIEFATQVEEMLITDFAHSQTVCDAHFSEKPLWFRAATHVARLASPLL